MARLLKKIDYNKPIKIEVGSGNNPQSGYYHVDINRGLPDLHATCVMGEEALPFPSECAEEILSNHSIEHVSHLKVDFVVRDWARVLKRGGRLFLRTPDLEFICKSYLERKITPEAPHDENNLKRIFGEYGPAEWANLKLFAGEDYPGNFHYLCFDMDMLTRLLKLNGFEKVKRIHIEPIFSPGEIQCEAFKK